MTDGYYYIISFLPELSLNDKSSEWNMLKYKQVIRPMLKASDARLLDILYYKYDIQNVVMLMLENGNEFHPAGNFTEKQLREGLAQPDLLPDFLREFIEDNIRNREKKSEKTLLNEATTYFVDWCKSIKNPLLKRWMHFENNLKNLLIWLNSHKFDLDPTKELVGNHFEADYLRQTEKDQIDLKAWEYHFRDVLTHYDNSNIAVREFIIDEMRWHYLNELEESYIFGIERLLCFAIRLQLINRNIAATEEDGGEKINQLLTEIRAAYVMPEDF